MSRFNDDEHLMRWASRPWIVLRCLTAGGCIAVALPPLGWWPMAFLGVALWDRLLVDVSWRRRFLRTWLIGMAWFFPTLLWMFDLTPPGYLIASIAYAAYFGVAAAACPPGRYRWIALPGAIVLAEFAKSTFPFGGVPLSNLALTQAGSCAPPCRQLDSPLAQSARLAGPYLVIALVVIGGIALSAAWERRYRMAGVALAVVVGFTALGFVSPSGRDIGELRVAVIQGGGPQRTRTAPDDAAKVFARHVEATRRLAQQPVDVVIWPEDVVAVEGALKNHRLFAELQQLARDLDTTLIVGATETVPGTAHFLNASIVINPDGTMGERYDKVRTVPFGEFVPFRGIVEKVAGDSGIPTRDALPGTGPAVVHTGVGDFGIVISWEDFFTDRARDAIGNGGEVLLNPTNAASYWLTQVQSQQIAASRLRAIETGRWELQAAPTGFSAMIDPRGNLLERTNISDPAVINATIQRRTGTTVSVFVGPWPILLASLAAISAAWILQRRTSPTPPPTPTPTPAPTPAAGAEDAATNPSELEHQGDRAVVDQLDSHVGAEGAGGDP